MNEIFELLVKYRRGLSTTLEMYYETLTPYSTYTASERYT